MSRVGCLAFYAVAVLALSGCESENPTAPSSEVAGAQQPFCIVYVDGRADERGHPLEPSEYMVTSSDLVAAIDAIAAGLDLCPDEGMPSTRNARAIRKIQMIVQEEWRRAGVGQAGGAAASRVPAYNRRTWTWVKLCLSGELPADHPYCRVKEK